MFVWDFLFYYLKNKSHNENVKPCPRLGKQVVLLFYNCEKKDSLNHCLVGFLMVLCWQYKCFYLRKMRFGKVELKIDGE
jgi:hypothetical protein